MTIDPSVSSHPHPTPLSAPPMAPRRLGSRVRNIHGDHFDDPWDWLREKDNPEVIAHLHAENAWTDQVCAPTRELQQALVSEFKAYTTETDVSVPSREGDYWYYRRTQRASLTQRITVSTVHTVKLQTLPRPSSQVNLTLGRNSSSMKTPTPKAKNSSVSSR